MNNEQINNLMMASELVSLLNNIILLKGDKPVLMSIRRKDNEVIISNIKNIVLSQISFDNKTDNSDSCYILKNTFMEINSEDDISVIAITDIYEEE